MQNTCEIRSRNYEILLICFFTKCILDLVTLTKHIAKDERNCSHIHFIRRSTKTKYMTLKDFRCDILI